MPPDGIDLSTLPLNDLLVKRKSLRRRLSAREHLHPIRIAVLSGSTPNEATELLEILLLDAGFAPTFHLAEYGRYFVDAVHDPAALIAFAPDLVYMHTSVRNIEAFPPISASEKDFAAALATELARWQQIWSAVERNTTALLLQNTFEFPPQAILGNLDGTLAGGHTRFVAALNAAFAAHARADPRLLLNDTCALAARLGHDRWFDPARYFSYKIATTPEGSHALAASLTSIVRAIYGRAKKVLVLDLDNTLWGGVIGDDGPDRILIGRETPVAEAYTALQRFCLALRARGVLLAVASKNNDATAREGFAHPDSILQLDHFSAFEANWNPKPASLERIAAALNLGLDALVFVDDNPAERALVRAQLPQVAVPEVGADVVAYPAILEAQRYFETTSLSPEDLARASQYQANAQRAQAATQFATYGDYLDSLDMTAEIAPFHPMYLDRIAQLTNKTNQFNLTTRRYTLAELEATLDNPQWLGLYARLTDRFGDNGLVSVVLGQRIGDTLDIALWLMSCRVLKRSLEQALLDTLVTQARARGITHLLGTYIPSKKNAMVAHHYDDLGFTPTPTDPQVPNAPQTYTLDLTTYTPRNTHIRILEFASPSLPEQDDPAILR